MPNGEKNVFGPIAAAIIAAIATVLAARWSTTHCTPNASQECPCSKGLKGRQTCSEDGRWSLCECPPIGPVDAPAGPVVYVPSLPPPVANSSAFYHDTATRLQLHDTANLLSNEDKAKLHSKSASFAFNVRIITTGDYADRHAFSQYISTQVKEPNMVVVGIDPVHRRTSVHLSSDIGVPSDKFIAIEGAGNEYFRRGEWSNGIEAILAQLLDSK